MPLKDSSASPAVEPLRRVTDLWLDPGSAIRRKAIEALTVSTGRERAAVARAIDNAFGELTQEKLAAFARENRIPFGAGSDKIVLHIGAGNVFTAWLHGVVISLLMGFRCWIKPSTNEPVFAPLWHQSLMMIDFALAGRVSVVPWSDDLLKRVQAVIAYGADTALEALRAKTPAETLFVGYGHRLSVAVILSEALASGDTWREALADDLDSFGLDGCLSPQAVFVEGALERSDALTDGFGAPVKAERIASVADLPARLSGLKGLLSAVGAAGPIERMEALRADLDALGVTRICPLGTLQRPPLSWRNGGINLVEQLRKAR